jgi:3-hydroxybutyryl-CoA dehydrogenase
VREIRRVAVIGAGTMGRGIAHVSALAGCDVTLHDPSEGALRAALATIAKNLEGGVARGKLDRDAADAALARITSSDDLEAACDGVDLAVEAVPEDIALKGVILARVSERVAPDALVASNTSSLSVTELQMATLGPERVVCMHFFNPVHIMALVEVVRGERSSEEAVAAARRFAERLGKTPIVVRDSPGFATSRLGIALGNEAMRMVQEGVASAEDIDTAMTLGYRHPMGPLRLSDLVGLDVRLAITQHLYHELGTDTFRPPQILRQLVRAGKLGKKTGEGFYTYGEGEQ